VANDAKHVPAACQPRSLGRRLLTFGGALNAAQTETLKRIWASGFRLFSVGGPPLPSDVPGQRLTAHHTFNAHRPAQAIDYVRNVADFEVRFTSVQLNGYNSRKGSAEIGFTGIWAKKPGGDNSQFQVIGKGALDCDSPTIEFFVMAVKPDESPILMCPEPRREVDPNTIVACVNGSRRSRGTD
jgi:hypothetical protein